MVKSAPGRAPIVFNEFDVLLIGSGLAPGAAGLAPREMFRVTAPRFRSDDELILEEDEKEEEEETAHEPQPTIASRILLLAMPGLIPFLLAIFFVGIVRLDFSGFSDWYLRIFGAISFVLSLIIFIGGLMQLTMAGGAARGLFVMLLGVANFTLTFGTMIAGLALYEVLFIKPLLPSSHLVDVYRVASMHFFERMDIKLPQPVVQAALSVLGSILLSFVGGLGGRILRARVKVSANVTARSHAAASD
jgi:hypothetical protein